MSHGWSINKALDIIRSPNGTSILMFIKGRPISTSVACIGLVDISLIQLLDFNPSHKPKLIEVIKEVYLPGITNTSDISGTCCQCTKLVPL